ncbi:beta-galactosidase [Rhyzopertha dominica]|nr:beta-galactosidase [Rhyzopertha dominica]
MSVSVSANLPTLYEYYTSGGITSGLSVDKPYFTLNERNITLYSGAMHYFRVPKEYWRDRLRKMRAAGLNAIETYVPWNLHEPQQAVFDFGQGDFEMSDFLDIREFFKIVQEEDLFAIVRPGPYICTEWDFGGFPSWLLREKDIQLRTSQSKFMSYVERYFNILLPILALFQFSKGGPIIGFQVENEYGSTEKANSFVPDKKYLEELRDIMIRNGIEELLFTSDGIATHGDRGTLPGILFATANFDANPKGEFDALKKFQPNKPFMSMEYWGGWFDHWGEEHHTRSPQSYKATLEEILDYPASVNIYMFHGGTNFGFMNGANLKDSYDDNRGFQPDTTSYDYDAVLTEAGDYTQKYVITKEVVKKRNPIQTKLPLTPTETVRKVYPNLTIDSQLMFSEIIDRVPKKFNYKDVLPMELLPINNNSGQSYGYILYRQENIDIPANSILKISGRVCDSVVVLINGVLMSKPLEKLKDLDGFGFWRLKDSTLTLGPQNLTSVTLDLLVENWGRVNFGYLDQFRQYKGLWQGSVYLNQQKLTDWTIVPLEFKKSWNNALTGWHVPRETWLPGPALYKTSFVTENPQDTFLDMRDWTKGIVIINGFVLGRYAKIGPQQTLYLPAPFIRKGENHLVVFEHYKAADKIRFSANPIYHTAEYA